MTSLEISTACIGVGQHSEPIRNLRDMSFSCVLRRLSFAPTANPIPQRSKEQSPSLALVDLPREEPERSKAAGSSAAQSRRAKNAAHRADDVGTY
jgi:hypothetical protein